MTLFSSQARIESSPSETSENSELVGEVKIPSWRAEDETCVLCEASEKLRLGIWEEDAVLVGKEGFGASKAILVPGLAE